MYLHPAPFPSSAANAVQVAKMCAAFENAGAQVTLGVPSQGPNDFGMQKTEELYGLSSPLAIERFPLTRLPGAEFMFAWSALRSTGGSSDLIYTRSITACALAARLGYSTALELHVPATAHRFLLVGRLRRLLRSPRFKALVVISEKLKDDYVDKFPEVAGKIVVAHDGADPLNEAPLSAPQRLQGEFTVGYVGHLYPGKGMEIIAPLAHLCPWATFHIVGGVEPDLGEWKARLTSAPNVVFHGHVSHLQTKSYLAGMDVVVAPYLRVVKGVGGGKVNLAEGMSPLKIFEYMAAGKPILSSDLPVLREVLRNGENAMLCDPDDVGAWADTLNALRSNDELRRRIATQALLDLAARYSWNQRARLILDAVMPV